MKVFFGAAIQGAENREKRANIHKNIIDIIKKQGLVVYTEHTTGKNYDEAIKKLEQSIGKMPQDDLKRRIFELKAANDAYVWFIDRLLRAIGSGRKT